MCPLVYGTGSDRDSDGDGGAITTGVPKNNKFCNTYLARFWSMDTWILVHGYLCMDTSFSTELWPRPRPRPQPQPNPNSSRTVFFSVAPQHAFSDPDTEPIVVPDSPRA